MCGKNDTRTYHEFTFVEKNSWETQLLLEVMKLELHVMIDLKDNINR